MARRQHKHNRSTSDRKERPRRELSDAAAAAAAPSQVPSAEVTEPMVLIERPVVTQPPPREPPPVVDEDARRRDRQWAWVLVPIGGLLVLAILLTAQWFERPAGVPEPTPTPSIVLGEIGGEVLSPAPTPLPTLDPTPQPTSLSTMPSTPVPTPTPAAVPAAPAPTAVPTPTAVPITPLPATPVPATPEPTAVVASAGEPADAVAAFYAHAVDGEFDAAYALWSERMKRDFPREENLDGRFDDTAAITFTQLRTVAGDLSRAVVQANFVEEYGSGGTREFIGYWELVLVEGRWLLDDPHY